MYTFSRRLNLLSVARFSIRNLLPLWLYFIPLGQLTHEHTHTHTHRRTQRQTDRQTHTHFLSASCGAADLRCDGGGAIASPGAGGLPYGVRVPQVRSEVSQRSEQQARAALLPAVKDQDNFLVVVFLGEAQRRLALLRRGGGRVEVEAAATGGRGLGLGGAERRRGACAGPLPPNRPAPRPNLPPRPSALSLTLFLIASAPALSSDSTQGG